MSQPSPHRVAIIGGGLSGLATAAMLHLEQPSLALSLFEAADRVGGVIDTQVIGDFVIDRGADMFATNPPAAINLCRRLGVEDQLIQPQQEGRGAMIVRQGRLLPLPEGFVLMRATKLMPILTTRLLSPGGKVRLLLERWIHRHRSDDDESVGAFVRRRMGQQVLDRIVEPLVAGIYTADIEKLSMLATMGPLATMERTHGSLAAATSSRNRSGVDSVERASSGARYGQFRAFKGGMIELIRSLTSAIPEDVIRTESSIRSIKRSDDQWQVESTDRVEGKFDDVVIATPPVAASKLLQPLCPTAANELAAIESASTAIVVMAVRKCDIHNDQSTFGFVVPPIEKRRILAGSFASKKFAGRAPDDHVIVRVFMGGSLQPEMLKRTDDELEQIAREELADLIGLSGQPTLVRVVRWVNAMPQYHVGHINRVERIESELESLSGISLVGNALHGVGIAPVIATAENVVKQIVGR